jgi:purine-nucleoside phosphorylase
MRYTFADYQKAADVVAQRLGEFRPEVAMILGSGLGDMADLAQDPIVIPYGEIPGFSVSTAPGHKGQLVFGTLEGKAVAVMQGRLHAYEGYSFEEVCFPLRVLRLLGADKLVITNACGGVNLELQVGDICLITDHMKFFMDSPLRGKNLDEFGTRFPDATHLYTPRLQEVARQVAKDQGLPLKEGVYMYFPGPSYETPAEIRAIRILGADLVGMSTVPEVLAAGHCGMEVLGFSLVSNAAAGITGEALSEQEVLDAAAAAKERFSSLICGCIRDM